MFDEFGTRRFGFGEAHLRLTERIIIARLIIFISFSRRALQRHRSSDFGSLELFAFGEQDSG